MSGAIWYNNDDIPYKQTNDRKMKNTRKIEIYCEMLRHLKKRLDQADGIFMEMSQKIIGGMTGKCFSAASQLEQKELDRKYCTILANVMEELSAVYHGKIRMFPIPDSAGMIEKMAKRYEQAEELERILDDLMKGSAQFGLGLNGQNHRYKTLGHDPLLGWFFGTVNIMTDTATMNDLKTFDIENGEFVRRTTLYKVINDCISSAREDWHRVPAAVFAEGVHLKSDDFTKIGLPIPTLSFFNEKLAEQLCKFHYDKLCMQKDLKNIGKQIEISCFINLIVSAFHSLFYDPKKEDIKLYEVKTRKIMMYSNLIASTSNILYTVIATTCFKSKTAYQKIDIGGLIVTMYRLISDSEFILRIKREFIVNKINKKIQGCLLNLEEIL